jgi:hypothetical protein
MREVHVQKTQDSVERARLRAGVSVWLEASKGNCLVCDTCSLR